MIKFGYLHHNTEALWESIIKVNLNQEADLHKYFGRVQQET